MQISLFDEPVPTVVPARQGGVTRADILEQIKRDMETLTFPLEEIQPDVEFYRQRIASFREWARELA